MDNTFIPKGMEIMKQAVEADNAGQLEKALALYTQGLKYFTTGLKYEKNKARKTALTEKATSYMARAEEVKKAVDAQKRNVEVSSGGVAQVERKKDGEGGDDDEGDAETRKLQDSLSSAIIREKPNVKWDDVAGLEGAKALLQEAVILPVKFPQLFTGKRRPWKGILLYGPPGTGKSFLAKAVATEAGASCFLSVSSSNLVSKFQGESEKLVKNLFDLARKNAPSIIFIDEVDSLCSARGDGENESARRIKTEFLVQMDGVGKDSTGVLVLGATNTPWELDPAIRRRFEKRVYIPLPDVKARNVMFHLHVGNTPHAIRPEEFKALAQKTEGFSGADIGVMVRDALYEAIRTCQGATHFKKVKDPSGKEAYLLEPCSPGDPQAQELNLMQVPGNLLKPPEMSLRDLRKAMSNAKTSVGKEDLERFDSWTKDFGLEG
eukprot:gb/GEZN01008058.1/.p1 GENE.gb/GEZN01008058.1/~~gb/GEZN01008058.1/.p1  ORF type:complete len:435 (+),score=75.04 gb/GEZN01008058.1/:59-1363(+)